MARIVAVLALLGQLAAWSASAPAAASFPGVDDGICHAPADDGAPGRAPAPADHNCDLCTLCLSHAAPAPLIVLAPTLPVPPLGVIAAVVVLPPATAPPPRPYAASRPRGPPAPV